MDKAGEVSNDDLSRENNLKRLKEHNAHVDKMIQDGVIPEGKVSDYIRSGFWWRGHVPMQIEQLIKKRGKDA